MIGTRIGNYRIVTELGAGAMGEVYFAEHAVMGRRAAIKIIRHELSGNAEMVERFVNEARLVNRIGHPNIVEITDFGQIDGRYYIMMELLEGETLEERLERVGRLTEALCMQITLQITAALGAAHQLGVVHRDLKPENIYLQRRPDDPDFVKLLDFGIAKLMGSLPSVAAGTLPGTLLGTPHYMSPEQCFGAATLDHRTDIYALGVILYRALTGVLPFDGNSLLAILHAQANDPPRPPRELNPEISARLETVVLKAMAKDPADRFVDMAQMRAALEGRMVLQPLAPAQPRVRDQGPAAGRTTAIERRSPTEDGRTFMQPSAAAAKDRRATAAETRGRGQAQPAQDPRSTTGAVPARGHAGSGDRRATHTAEPRTRGQTQAANTRAVQHTVAKDAQRDTDRAPDLPGRVDADPTQGQRVGSKLARILVERIHHDRLILPNMPSAARECLDLLDDPHGGLTAVAQAIGRDPIIAPQIMRRATSVMLSGHAPVRTLEQAVQRLGARQLRSILIDLCARRLFESKNPAIRRAVRGIWEHSIAVAILARGIARRRRDVDPDTAYLSGLLHDVGKPVAAALLLEAEREVDKPEEWLAGATWLDVINECHREIGVALARSWQLQDEVVHAIARSERYATEGPGTTTSVVCFANALAKREGLYTGPIDFDAVDGLIRDGMLLFRIEPEMLTTLLAELHEESAQGVALGS